MSSDQKKLILIVEDAMDVQALLASLLKSEEYSVVCASNGREALELLNSMDDLPGVILLDLMMPEMNGYQFREAQEKHDRIASIPVIVMTADGDIQSKSMKVGSKGFLKKPFTDIHTILETVSRFFPQ